MSLFLHGILILSYRTPKNDKTLQKGGDDRGRKSPEQYAADSEGHGSEGIVAMPTHAPK